MTRAGSVAVAVGIIHDNAASSTPFFVGAKWQREREREERKEGKEGRGEEREGVRCRRVRR